ncbi:hypothetical protein MK139_16265 [bacterium]|nr:hypothetical protein [bacterium]
MNTLLNILAASVIAFHQDKPCSVIILAVFLSIISDVSSHSEHPAILVSIRKLTLGVTHPRNIFSVF